MEPTAQRDVPGAGLSSQPDGAGLLVGEAGLEAAPDGPLPRPKAPPAAAGRCLKALDIVRNLLVDIL